ncbi:MAG TPA: hypothetical protein VF647_22455 [Longimicrobium sp.]|jgi:hypothetical protein
MTFPTTFRRLSVLVLGAALAACGGGGDSEAGAKPEDVDQETSVAVTEKEEASFKAPADSSLTPQQVEAYLKTSLLQFDLVRKEAGGVQRMEERAKGGGVMAGLRNMSDAAGMMDRIGGSYVRSARTLKYNPAEMEYVRERMGEIGGFLTLKPMLEGQLQSAQQMRQQANELRAQMASGQLQGYTEENIKAIEDQAAEMERGAKEQMGTRSAVGRNLEVLRRARPAVTEEMWATVGFAGGSAGLLGLSGLANPQDTTAQRQLNDWRRIYTDALANRVSPGMEKKPPAAPTPAQ